MKPVNIKKINNKTGIKVGSKLNGDNQIFNSTAIQELTKQTDILNENIFILFLGSYWCQCVL